MTIHSDLKTTLAPCFQLAKLAHTELNAKAATQHATIGQIINTLTYVDKKPSVSVGVIALAEDVYDFFTKEFYQSMSLIAQKEQIESSRLLIKHELLHYDSNISTSQIAKVLENYDRHISVLNDLSSIARACAISKIATGCLIATGAVLGLANSSIIAGTAIGMLYSLPTAAYHLNIKSQLSSMDYKPSKEWFERPKPSIRDRLLQNYHNIAKLDLGFQK